MKPYRHLNDRLHAAALLSMWAYAAAEVNAGLALLSGAFVAVSWVVSRRRAVSPVPRWALYALLVLASAGLFARFREIAGDISAVITAIGFFLATLVAVKLFETRTPRNTGQTLVLTAMLAIAAVLTSVSLSVGVLLLGYAVSIVAAAMAHQLYAGQWAQLRGAGDPLELIVNASAPAGRNAEPALLRAAGAMSLGIAAVGVLAFLLMPRQIGQSIFGAMPAPSAGAVSGFRDQVQLGGAGIVSESRQVVAEVELFAGDAKLTVPVRRYFRGEALDDYEPRRAVWRRSGRLSSRDRRPDRRELEIARRLPPVPPEGAGFEQHVTLRSKSTPHLFAMWRPIQIGIDGGRSVRFNDIDGTIRAPEHSGYVRYEVRSVPHARPLALEAGADPWAEPPPAIPFFQTPGSPVHARAADVLARAGVPMDPAERDAEADRRAAAAISNHFVFGYRYTLEQTPSPGRDPIEAFLYDTRAGHCEYFAAAMVAMCRAAGLDARMITGYATSELDPATGAYLIRRSHAHAWVEVALVDQVEGERRWMLFDPTPSADLRAMQQPPGGIASVVERVLDRLEQLWVTGVVAFDRDAQEAVLGIDTAEHASRPRGGPLRSLQRWLRHAAQAPLSAALDLGIVVAIAGAGVMLLAGGIRGLRSRRTLWLFGGVRPGLGDAPPEAAALRARLVAALRVAVAERRAEGEPVLAYAARAPDHTRAEAQRAARLYYRVRFGGETLSAGERDEVARLITTLRARRSPRPAEARP